MSSNLGIVFIHDDINLKSYEQELRTAWERMYNTYGGLEKGWNRKVEIVNTAFPKNVNAHILLRYLEPEELDELPVFYFVEMSAPGKIDEVYGFRFGTPNFDEINEEFKEIFVYYEQHRDERERVAIINNELLKQSKARRTRQAKKALQWIIAGLAIAATTLIILNRR
jgi:hypothetical protein